VETDNREVYLFKSKYLERFSKLEKSGNSPDLYGGRLVVEVLPEEELKSEAGLIIQTVDTHKSDLQENRPTLVIVLMVGNGYVDEDSEKVVSLPYKLGEILMVSAFGLKYLSQFPGLIDITKNRIALTRDSEVHMSWSTLQAFEDYKQSLNN